MTRLEMMKPLSANGALAQLSHSELIRLLVADPRCRPVVQEFVSRYDIFIRQTVARALRSRMAAAGRKAIQQRIEDFVNEIYCRLFQRDCQALRSFKCRYENSIFAYLRIICLNAVRIQIRNDMQKNRCRQLQSLSDIEEKSGERLIERNAAASGALAAETDTTEFSLLEQAIRAGLCRAFSAAHANRNFIIFKLHFIHGYQCREIAHVKALGLSTKRIGNIATHIRKWLSQELQRAKKSRLRPEPKFNEKGMAI
jgi:RNA polymerase sigma factor (sigma-70 family)